MNLSGNHGRRPSLFGRLSSWLSLALLVLSGPMAFAQLSGTYTINSALPTSGTNYASFSAAATALNTGGVSGPVTFNVSGGPYTEQLLLNGFTGASATNRVTFNGNGRTIQFSSGTSAQRAVITLNGADYVTLDSLVVDATVGGTGTGTYGFGVQLVNNANNNVIRRCRVSTSTSSTSTNFVAISSSASTTSATASGTGFNQNLTLEDNIVSGGYYCITHVGNTTAAPGVGLVMRNNRVRDYYFYGLYLLYQSAPLITGNDISRPTRSTVSTFYGVYLSTGNSGAIVTKNRIHNGFDGAAGSTAATYAIYVATGTTATTTTPHLVANNLIYNIGGNGTVYALYNTTSNNVRYYYNTINVDEQNTSGTSTSYGLYQTTGTGVEFKNNIVRLSRSTTGVKYPIYASSAAGAPASNNNDLTGGGTGFSTGYYLSTAYPTLANWQTANSRAFDQNSVAADPRFVNVATGQLIPSDVQLNGTAAPQAAVTDDITGAPRNSATPDMGAFEFTPVTNDVAVLSIDAPTATATPGNNPVTVTIRNGGAAVLTSVTLSYVVDSGAPVSQSFTGLTLAAGATQQLTFTTGFRVASGPHTLTVTGSLPNGLVDGNPANNTQTTSFNQPTPDNDEPCTAVGIGTTAVASSTSGASTSLQTGIVLPSCSPAASPKDVWFSFTPTTASLGLNIAGSAAGMVRVFTAPDCAAGPFTQVFCHSSGANNTTVGNVSLTGLAIGQRYYVAISGFGSSDTEGAFTISTTVATGTRNAANYLLTVFPNPSNTGQLTLRLAGTAAGPGTAELLNSLGQLVLRQALSGPEAQLSTRGLAAGLYTLQVRAGGQVMTRKVVLQ